MLWDTIPLNKVHYMRGSFCLKVAETDLHTVPKKLYKDSLITLQGYRTTNGRLIGYVLTFVKNRKIPMRMVRNTYGYLSYFKPEDIDSPKRKQLLTVYHDNNMRMLKFGNRKNSYLLLSRKKEVKDAQS